MASTGNKSSVNRGTNYQVFEADPLPLEVFLSFLLILKKELRRMILVCSFSVLPLWGSVMWVYGFPFGGGGWVGGCSSWTPRFEPQRDSVLDICYGKDAPLFFSGDPRSWNFSSSTSPKTHILTKLNMVHPDDQKPWPK